MSHKILVADDSQTIQKVISLASKGQDFDLISCLSANELMESLSNDIDLILLDFSLDESKDGYELCAKIKTECPNVPVMALLGVFDSVDEANFQKAGYGDRIVKPFETEKFINKCIALINDDGNKFIPSEDDEAIELDSEEWTVDGPSVDEEQLDATAEHDISDLDDIDETTEIRVDQLDSELAGWGFDPDELAKKDVTHHFDEFPPVIGEEALVRESVELSADLPDVIEDNIDVSDETREIELPVEISDVDSEMSEVIMEDETEFDDNDFDVASEEEFESLKSELASELEGSPDDFWAAPDEPTKEVVESLEVVDRRSDLDTEKEIEVKLDEAQSENFQLNAIPDDIVEGIRKDLKPLVEKYVQEYCEKEVERVVWEIVPDLAENIIKKELSTLRKNVEQSL